MDSKGDPNACREKNVPYFVAERKGRIVVVPALGHLYTVAQKDGGKTCYPVFSFHWVPRHRVEKNDKRTKSWIAAISKLAVNANVFIDACDYDIEGSLIGYCILNYACGKADVAKRMKYSTLTKAELESAYERPIPKLDLGFIEAGKTRHEIDWMYGINLSRALTSAAKRVSGRYTILSTGRVQGPTLRFLVERENLIVRFVPKPYWSIEAQVEMQNKVFSAEFEAKKIENKQEADAVMKACKGKKVEIVKVEHRTLRLNPPVPFDLGTLQREAYRLFGYNPTSTAYLAQRLYLDALISYPRTSSQKLPPVIDYRTILMGLSKERNFREVASELLDFDILKPREGPKKDSAHPAVYPTGNRPKRKRVRKLWDLIVRRFMAVFGEAAIVQEVKMAIDIDGYHFFLSGRKTVKEGWTRFYKPYVRMREILLPNVKEGEKARMTKIVCESKFTKPPLRYNPGSLLKKMEKEGIGTKATRANIIQTLYRRKYIKDKNIEVTALGRGVTEILLKHASSMISVDLTRELEEKMEQIQHNEEKRENVLSETIKRLKPVLEKLKRSEESIGKELSGAFAQMQLQEREVGNCPTCEIGKLVILCSRKTGKRFVGCTNYFNGTCKTSFPLPQRGTVSPTRKTCRVCGWSTVRVSWKNRKSWNLCLNPLCPRKKERKKHPKL